MAGLDWSKALDLGLASTNLNIEMVGDWHQDPWGWPELSYLANERPDLVYDHARSSGTLAVALMDVPKDNWGTRPAVVLQITDKLLYQALVDRLSVPLIGTMSPNAFGWRLPPTSPKAGTYSHNNHQWENYRDHLSLLAGWHTAALKTDIVSFFASIPVEPLQEAIMDHCGATAVSKRLCNMVESFDAAPDRSGLPQRSTASSVLANMYLAPVDDVLLQNATAMPAVFNSKVRYHSFARWMDDIWTFGFDPAAARRTQMQLQAAAQSLGLNLNYAKTDVLEGNDVVEQARAIEHSAVDDAIITRDFGPLEDLIDSIVDGPEKANRTSIKFACQRMRNHGQVYRVKDLIFAARRMPHAADALSQLFKEIFRQGSLQDFFLDYAASDWATHEWSVAYYGRMFPSSKVPRRQIRNYFADTVRSANTSLPLLAVAAQRLAAWDPAEARTAFRDAFKSSSPHGRRVLALAALDAGETRTKVRSWLKADAENLPTLAMLESRSFAAPKVQAYFAG